MKEVEGIILSETNYSETSKILNILTNEYGLIGVISKGCRNLKSPLRSVSSKLTYGKFIIYYKKDKLSILKEVNVHMIQGYFFGKPMPVEEFEKKYL